MASICLADLIDRCHAVHRAQQPFTLIVGKQRRCVLMIYSKTLAQRLGIVVGTRPAGFGSACLDTCKKGVLVDLNLDHGIERQTPLLKHRAKAVSLGDSARCRQE